MRPANTLRAAVYCDSPIMVTWPTASIKSAWESIRYSNINALPRLVYYISALHAASVVRAKHVSNQAWAGASNHEQTIPFSNDDSMHHIERPCGAVARSYLSFGLGSERISSLATSSRYLLSNNGGKHLLRPYLNPTS